jgi:hypothetical protein
MRERQACDLVGPAIVEMSLYANFVKHVATMSAALGGRISRRVQSGV